MYIKDDVRFGEFFFFFWHGTMQVAGQSWTGGRETGTSPYEVPDKEASFCPVGTRIVFKRC